MTIYIALLRGINVGGHHKIKMADLRKMLEGMGLTHVQTYIQSGNVLFQSAESKAALRAKMEQGILEVFGFPVPVLLRTSSEIEGIIRNCPFSEERIRLAEEASEFESLYVAMLPAALAAEEVEKLKNYANDKEAFEAIGEEVYLLFKESVRNSKLAGQLSKLSLPVTMRNWKTMNKLAQLAMEMQNEPPQ
ncbi:hypothetical protein PVOR_20659 [Paenibacillus vortex V453]|uniref:Cytoplasmic protein n=1 Tax=Paenibacillus vortex V453 TaxID=715225 RepID=A0A2R9SQW4_9BACL|nr:DUF1697 domain-containing protein [Paenibacillus vortex]EFU39748.1 hypothetical protein PVOR_20659 [Paenibacillus vortex V453]